MFYRQNNSNIDPKRAGLALVLLICGGLFVVISNRDRGGSHPYPSASPPAWAPQKQAPAPAVNPLTTMLRPPTEKIERHDGIAAIILVDTSGSMGDKVKDAAGQPQPKIQIAQRCALSLVRQCDSFARQNTGKQMLLGLYEFSGRPNGTLVRRVIPLGPPELSSAEQAIAKMHSEGGTPIGNAIIAAKKDLDKSGYTRLHILVVTDGENTQGYAPGDVTNAISRLPEQNRASIYFVAFDIAAERFKAVRDAGGLVLPAGNEQELQQTLDYVLTGKILAEQPNTPAAK